MILDEKYMENRRENKRMRKKPEQMEILKKEFELSTVWSYSHKVKIAKAIGMTFHQVSKWNWDYRKKMGLSTKREAKKGASTKE